MIEICRILACLKLGPFTGDDSLLGQVLFSIWKRTVGEKIAGVCSLISYRKSVLKIGVADDHWHRELAGMKNRIEDRFRSLAGRNDLEIRLVKVKRDSRKEMKAEPGRPALTPDGNAPLSGLGREIRDEELRAIFLNVYRRYKEMGKKEAADSERGGIE